jgi:hypothetical protein
VANTHAAQRIKTPRRNTPANDNTPQALAVGFWLQVVSRARGQTISTMSVRRRSSEAQDHSSSTRTRLDDRTLPASEADDCDRKPPGELRYQANTAKTPLTRGGVRTQDQPGSSGPASGTEVWRCAFAAGALVRPCGSETRGARPRRAYGRGWRRSCFHPKAEQLRPDRETAPVGIPPGGASGARCASILPLGGPASDRCRCSPWHARGRSRIHRPSTPARPRHRSVWAQSHAQWYGRWQFTRAARAPFSHVDRRAVA